MARIVGWGAGVFYAVDRRGALLPDGPVLVTANHPNALLDPLVIFRTAGRPARPLAKAPLFEHTLVGPFLRALGGLPVYRRQDDPSLMHLNEKTFDAAIVALQAGDAVQIYPEGVSHSEHGLVRVRTGAARIALMTEDRMGWEVGLVIAPVGLTYVRKTLFRGRVVASYGEPFPVAPYRDAYRADPEEAVRVLTDEIRRSIETLTLVFAEDEDRDLVDVAERLYAREKGLTPWRDRDSLGRRLPRLQAFARGLAWLRAHDPELHADLARRVRRYRSVARALGAGEADVPPRYGAVAVARWVVRQGLALGLGAPAAALGVIAWYVPYLLPRVLVRMVNPPHESISTYKFSGAFIVFPLFYALWVGLAWWWLGPWWSLAAALVLPASGLVAISWRERWGRVKEDARLFLRVVGAHRTRGRLAALRRSLVEAFDDVAGLMEEEGDRAPDRPEG